MDESPGVVPVLEGDHLDIGAFLRGEFGEDVADLGVDLDGLAGLAIFSGRTGQGFFLNAIHVIVKFVGRAGTGHPLAVHKELFEVPLALGDCGDADLPDAVGIGHKSGDDLSAADDGLLRPGPLIDDRAGLCTAILFGQDQRLGDRIGPRLDPDRDRLGKRAGGLELSYGVAGRGQSC